LRKYPSSILALACFLVLARCPFILLIIQDARSAVLTPAHVSHFRHVSAQETSVVLLSIANTGNITCSLLLCFFLLFLCQSVRLFDPFLTLWSSFNRRVSFSLLCTAANCWHIFPMSSTWSEDFSLSPSRMTSSCVTSRQCVLLRELQLMCLTAVQNA